jgi:hypothetical protein
VKRKKGYNSTIGKLFFIIPIVIIAVLVIYAYVQLNAPGTVVVRAELSNGTQLAVGATVDGKTGETPLTLHVTQGNYVVNFTNIQGYYPPAGREVGVLPGRTVYAVALYQPVVRVIRVTSSGFNATVVTALRGVTPVNWTDPGGSAVSFDLAGLGVVSLVPGQEFSHIFDANGAYNCTMLSTGYSMTVDVT